MKNIALVGLGYWGKNLLRNFCELGVLKYGVDLEYEVLTKHRRTYPSVIFTADYNSVLEDPEVQGVVVATPPSTHFGLAMQAIKHNKHVFVEKPITLDVGEAQKIMRAAEEAGVKVLVGHVFLYAPEIIKLKEIATSEEFGKLLYIHTNRLNLGKVQNCGVIADLMPHDVSIVNYLTDSTIDKVSAVSYNQRFTNVDDSAIVNLVSKNGVVSTFHLSWMVPHKTRTLMVVGEKQTAVCDSITKTIRIYNSNVSVENKTPYYSCL